jgi:hypothetical protein
LQDIDDMTIPTIQAANDNAAPRGRRLSVAPMMDWTE